MDDNKELIPLLNEELAVKIPSETTAKELLEQLTGFINDLIVHDFNQLLNILYRLDVSENKLKQMLGDDNPGDAGKIIAALIIERQLQKIKSRQQFKQRDNTIDENEKW